MLSLIQQAVYYLKIQIHSRILALECYIISFNGIDPFIFIFPFINFFPFLWLVGGGGGGYIFGRRINWGVSFGYGGGGHIFNKFELVKKSPFSFLPP